MTALTTSRQSAETGLVLKARNGSRHAYNELVRLHASGVLNVVYRMSGDYHLAEDAAQEAFVKAWLKLDSYHPGTSFRSWLYRIAVNVAVDLLRKEKRVLPHQVETLVLEDKDPGPETITEDHERREIINAAVIDLPDACRAVLILREYEGLSYRAISEILEIPVGTVMSRLNYARKVLREKLQKFIAPNPEAENE
jgi:RNA polymerase sigma-70 factor (ECF subfamily)